MKNKMPSDFLASNRVLHIDDDETNRFVVAKILRRAGFEVDSAETGRDGLSKLEQSAVDLIILDIQLPDINGIELCRIIKAHEEWETIPVLQMSANFTSSGDKVVGLESGADGYLAQPIDPAELVATARALLRIRRAEQRALAANLEAKRANLAKSQFLANMSHEIRTPLGAIMGFLDLLKNPENSRVENERYMGIIDRNTHQLMRLINDILDLSKVEAGKLLIEAIPFSLTDMLQGFASQMKLKAAEKNIEFEMTSAPHVPVHIISDPVRLKQILTNVVGNAIKFTDRGSVKLHLDYRAPDLFLQVRDTGKGISPQEAEKLFQPFVQADGSVTRNFGGTGLGLVLTRHLAEALQGEFHLLESTPGCGSFFEARVTIQENTHGLAPFRPAQNTTREDSLQNLHILVVEDSIDNQIFLQILLKAWGAEVEMASNGIEGYQKAMLGGHDLILMDIQMPLEDGHSVTRRLRKARFSKPIIALTAHAM
jgi:signal transduction histidine kinase